MSKRTIRQVRVCLNDHMREVEDITANMCDKLSDLPDSFRKTICSGVVYMALFDSGFNDEDFWENVSDFLLESFVEYFDSQTDFSDTLPRSRRVAMEPNHEDIRQGSRATDLVITDIDVNDSERIEYVVGVSDEIPRHYHWDSREDMEYTAELIAEQVAEMFAEYDLASDEDFAELACVIRDAVFGENLSVKNVDRFDINLNRRRLIVGVKTGSGLVDLDMSLFNRFEVDDALSIRNGSRSH